MKKQVLFLSGVIVVAAFIPVVFADIITPTETQVYFEENGVPYEGSVEYTVSCYGYSYDPGQVIEENESMSYDELVFEYSATCPEYGCTIYEDYYRNYTYTAYCDVEGELEDGRSFHIGDFGDDPYTECVWAEDFGSCVYDCTEKYCVTYFDFEGFEFFSDVSSDDENYEAIFYVKEQGIVSGYADGTFRSDNTINRAEFVKIIVGSVIGDGYECTSDVGLSDLDIDAWYYPYVCAAKEYGFIGGYPDLTFKPANEINFAEAAKVIVEGFGYEISDGDVWYEPYVRVLQQKNAIPESITSIDQYVTRGEVAQIIYRLLEGITYLDAPNFL